MAGFTVVDLTAQGELRLKARYEYELLEKIEGAPLLIGALSAELWKNSEEFEISLATPPAPKKDLVLRWRSSAPTAGIATLRDAERTLSLSLLASGLNEDADTVTLQALQTHVVRELHDTGYEASFDLMNLKERPLVATIGLFVPQMDHQRWAFALADRCFAAAYFRKLGLA